MKPARDKSLDEKAKKTVCILCQKSLWDLLMYFSSNRNTREKLAKIDRLHNAKYISPESIFKEIYFKTREILKGK